MKIERTKNATKGILTGLILRTHQTVVPFIMRTIMIYFLGVQYLGLNSLFTSILSVLNLAELGVGNAMVFSMYKPISEDNTEEICALMRLYKIYYRIIGAVIGGIGLILLPFIRSLIKGDVPNDINVYILYSMNLCSTVLSYWLFAYKNCLLQAHQRVDIISLISLVATTVKAILQIIVIVYFKNYYLYVLMHILGRVVNNIFISFYVSRKFPNYEAKGKLEKKQVKDINCRIRDLFTSKVGGVVLNSADTIVISSFLGLTALAVYQNYFYLITAIIGIVQIIFTSMMAGLGNSFVVDTKEKIFKDCKKITFLFHWLIGFCTNCFLCLLQPFIKIWVGEELMLSMSFVVILCFYFYFYEINRLLNVYKDSAGLWHEDRFRPLTAAIVNLVLNLILVNYWGLYGVLLSTVFSILFVEMPWLIHNLFSVFFDHEYRNEYLLKLIKYFVTTVFCAAVTFTVCSFINVKNDWMVLFLRLLICMVLPNIIFGLLFFKTREFKMGKELLLRAFANLKPKM
ncbi:oligosaccharide flippase family protein [Oribacterium sp. P6A1]|uniref:oligosaccharide flippase family protein n=1 Tax=Oribacterium sp. P6A1 TaxID=1410612 RepID=UPI00055C7CF9|nr:oligosaccharide flippase family protein [Oribacterium sp. P6A1]